MSPTHTAIDPRVAVLVDCDNTRPDILDFALKMSSQFGRLAPAPLAVQESTI